LPPVRRDRHRQFWVNPRFLIALCFFAIGVQFSVFSIFAKFPNDKIRHNSLQPEVRGPHESIVPKWASKSKVLRTGIPEGPEPGSYLYGITCRSSSDCWAVGAYYSGSGFRALIEHWNGLTWAFVAAPSVSSIDSYLSAVTCLSDADCWAVGANYNETTSRFETLTQHWDGNSWMIVNSPNATAVLGNELNAVTCNSASDCWAVGYYGRFSSTYYRTLIEHWDGTSWSIVASPNTSDIQHNGLSDVSCSAPSDCWTVGYTTFPHRALIQHWNGAVWSFVNPANLGGHPHALYGLACTGISQCWAVGYANNGNANQTLAEKWDGTSWTFFNTPYGEGEFLYRVTCTSASDCWAVGDDGEQSGTTVAHWDGTSWAIVDHPRAADSEALYDVTCASPEDCWAVGFSYPNGQLIEHWDGKAWSIFSMPPPLSGIVSRKTHGSAGEFDVDLGLDGSGIECRSGGANGAYQMVFTFTNNLISVTNVSTTYTVNVTSSLIGPSPNQYTVNLSGVATSNVQVVLSLVQDSACLLYTSPSPRDRG
jgi:hypothetical protein